MSRWDALFDAMRTSRTSRIAPDLAEQLLAGEPGAPEHAGLAKLLASAAAPARPHELAGEQAVVEAFVRARREPASRVQPPRTRDARSPRFGRMAAAKVAAGVALVVAGGTAFAAETGYLPDPAQRRAHDLFSSLGVPAPSTGPTVTSRPPSAGPSAATGTAPATDPSASAATVALCRAWVAAQRGPHTQEIPADDLRALAAAAGGRDEIRAFCARLLGEDHGGAPSKSEPPSPTPSHPGNKGKGKGRSGDGRPEPGVTR